ncbi:MAG: hypothetical protein KF770_08525 [Anaerolineae bacterium]|nr:hypothetical protein [Anaerolineae bacterium]
MAETIPGGAYLRSDGKSVVDANGHALGHLVVEKGRIVPKDKALRAAQREPEVERLPDEFPGVKLLRLAGYETRASLVGLSRAELIAFDGIGEVTADRILEELAQLPPI